jgi:two-component system sensor histidine kinase UhpB
VVGKVNRDILTVNYLERTIEIIEALNEGKSWQGELIYFTKSGKQINGLTTVSLLKNAEGNKIGTITLIRDITARKKVEMALSKLNEELEDRVKERTGVIEKVFSEKNSILESIGDAFFAFDRNWIVTYWNRIAEIEFGADKLKVIDNQLWAIFPKSNTPKSYEKYHLALESNKVVHFEEYFASSNKWYEISAFPSKIGLSVYLRNVTERKITEQKVRDSEARLKEAQAFAHISNWEMDLVTNINIWSDEFYNILEIRHGDVEPSPEAFLTVIHPDDVIRITKFLEVIFQTHENASFSARVNTKSGIAKYIYAEGKFEFDENKKPIRLYGILMDVTEKTVYEETIKQSEFQIRNFAKHLTKMQEEERAHIAREIHDELGQQFVGIKIGLSSFLKINNILPEVKNNVINMMSSVDTAIQSLRKIATELRPGILDTLGLAVSIEWLVKEFERKTGIPCKIDMNVKEQIFGKDISICLFRICQEALTNISKHAECSKVRVVFLKNEDELLLQIIDNGKGMSSEKLANPFSMGLLGIRERANNIGGQLEVVSKKGEGTKIQITVNIN